MRLILSFLKLNHGDRSVLLQSYLLLTLVRLGLLLLPFERLWKGLIKLGQLQVHPSAAIFLNPALKTQGQKIQQVIWAVNLSARFTPGGAKCLARALTTKVLLDWRQCPSDFKIGVAKDERGNLEAHAWIEVQNHVVMGQVNKLNQYKPMPSLPI
jgi:Transglutaminase-like superfamily